MCILADHEIQALAQEGRIEPYEPASLTPNGYDLRVREVLLRGAGDATREGIVEVPPARGFLVSTREYVKMPPDVTGQLWIRSSYARRGVLASFGKVEAGFEGELTLSAFNSSNETLKVPIGDRFAQLIFERMNATPTITYEKRSGNYQGQRGVTLAREDSP